MRRNITMVQFYNSLTRKKTTLTPVKEGKVGMYVCGPTVYDYAHIGNARPVIIFDVLFRFLRLKYGVENITYVRNITDVDDKINARAAAEKRSIRDLTDETLAQFHLDIADLGTLAPTVEPRATDYIDEMVTMISQLIEKGYAYEAEGHVLFEVHRLKGYGELSNRSLDDMLAGARVEIAPYKRNPMDFILWKPSDDNAPGWQSPWGYGRPGWHIECSAMSSALLGTKFDIHGGGIDLIFPHHENEIAQSCACHGTDKMASIWMHNGFVQVEGEKMSKSLGNFYTIRQLLDEWDGEILRLTMLMTHYRQPINWTQEGMLQAKEMLGKWRKAIMEEDKTHPKLKTITPDSEIIAALGDDLNTPRAIARLHSLFKIAKKEKAGYDLFIASARLLGLLLDETEAGIGYHKQEEPAEALISDEERTHIEALIKERNEARKAKNFARSDEIRDDLLKQGIKLIDDAKGTYWVKE